MSTTLEREDRQGMSGAITAQSLTTAFACFTEAAGSLERSYRHLEGEVARLRAELEQRNAELARSLEENLQVRRSLHRILEGLPCGVLVAASPSGEVSTINPEALRLLEAGQGRLRTLSELPPEFRTLLDQARKNTGESEVEIPLPSREMRCVTARHAVLGKGADLAESSVFILQDVTERKRFAAERKRMDHQQTLTQVSAALAHEIRNPLGSLELFAGLLAESDLEPEYRGWVEHLQAGLRMLAATVNNVLEFHNLPCPQLAPTDLGELLGWIGQFLSPLAKQSCVRLNLVNHLAGVEIPADRHRLEQVLINLALNAMRFMPGGGSLQLAGSVERSQARGLARIEVADTGPGIPEEYLERIFEAGYTTRPGSPGLGLTVCRAIVEQHGGTIHAGNRPEGGATFHLTLPLGEAA